MRKSIAVLSLLFFAVFASRASAHYLWVTIDNRTGEHGAANIYFEEGPAAGGGDYNEHFNQTSKTWFRTVKAIEARAIDITDVQVDNKRWLQAELPADAPRSVECYGKFGVYAYGDTDVLLHYYARCLDVAAHEDLHELSRAEHLDLDIVLHDEEDEIKLTVLWRGEAAAKRTVHIRGPKQFRVNLETDDDGVARFTPNDPGRYTLRTYVEEDIAGRDGDDEYDLIRHHGTMIITLPLDE